MREPLLVLGLDGYDPIVGKQLMAEGKLPHLERLAETSAVVDLDHGEAKRTGLAWEHFATGLNPSDANRFSAVDFDPDSYSCIQSGTRLPPFTQDIGRKVVIFDAPYFDLAQSPDTNGLVGWGAHDPGVAPTSKPAAMAKQVRQKFGDYPAKQWIYGHTWPSPENTRRSGEDLTRATRLRAKIAKWMLTEQQPDWELAVVVVSELHSATEALWHGVDPSHPLADAPSASAAGKALVDVYEAVDELVGELLAALPNAGVIAFNMHGMGSNTADVPSMALLPELMYRRHFGKALLQAPSPDPIVGLAMPPEQEDWSNTMRRYLPHVDADPTNKPATTRVLTPKIRAQVKKLLAPMLPPRHLKLSLGWMPTAWYASYWSDMDAFAFPAFYDGQIRVNLAGREARGCVDPADYANKLDELEQVLWGCLHPTTGSKLVRTIVRNHRNDPLQLGPTEADLIIVWDGITDSIRHEKYGLIGPFPYRRPGGHTGGHGIALIRGANVAPSQHLQRSAFDVVPSILDWLDVTDRKTISGESFLPCISS